MLSTAFQKAFWRLAKRSGYIERIQFFILYHTVEQTYRFMKLVISETDTEIH